MHLQTVFSYLIVFLLIATSVSSKKHKGRTSKSHSHSSTATKEKTKTSNSGDTSAITTTNDTTRPRPGATIILSSNGAILPPYSQLSITQLSSTSGLQCNGDTGASSAMWMLPDASSLEENSSSINGLQVRRITSVSNPNVELLITGTDPISTTGVFWCIVKYDNYVDMFPIWIVMDSSPPSIVTSGCQFAGFNPSDDTFGIYLTANVSTGAPSAILCSVNTQSAALDSKIFREVFRTESPTEAGVNIVTSVPRSSLPGTVTCTISNSEGSDSFTCNLRASMLGSPVINSITRDSQNSSIVTVTWSSISDPNGILDSYMVYVISSDGNDYIPFHQIVVTETEAYIRGLYPGYSYQVIVVATTSPSQLSSNQLFLPSISAVGSISLSQCQPANGKAVAIKLKLINCQEDYIVCSDRTMTETEELARSALVSCGADSKCLTMEPKIIKVYCNDNTEKTHMTHKKKNSKSSTKNSKSSTKNSQKDYDIKIKAMAVCNACTSSSAVESTPGHGTKKNRGKRSRMLRQIIDQSECELAYNGCLYSVNIDIKDGPEKLCHHTSIPSHQPSCDCPSQCYPAYIKTCTNSCHCSII